MLTNSLLYYFFLVYLARSKRPNTPHFVFKRIVRNFEVRVSQNLITVNLNDSHHSTQLITINNKS